MFGEVPAVVLEHPLGDGIAALIVEGRQTWYVLLDEALLGADREAALNLAALLVRRCQPGYIEMEQTQIKSA